MNKKLLVFNFEDQGEKGLVMSGAKESLRAEKKKIWDSQVSKKCRLYGLMKDVSRIWTEKEGFV